MAGKHLLYTGPISGTVRLDDGTEVDVTPDVLYLDSMEEVAAVAHQIGLSHAENGHPHDVEVDEKTGKRVQRKFVYDDSHFRKHGKPAKKGGK